jgi:drug/metabolite transporter (DMT)-like permease
VAILFAILAAATFGAADFVGGLASRRAAAVTVVVTSHLVGLSVVLVVAPLWGSSGAGPADVMWGAAAGVAGAGGLVILYHALATTRFSVAGPAAALAGAAFPVVFGLLIGERPELLAWAGVTLALPAILLISAGGGGDLSLAETNRRALLLGSLAGLLFAFFGIFISRTADTSGLWPLVGARLASIPLMVIVAVGLGMAANIFLLAALHEPGLVSLVILISSLYPGFTVILARLVIDECITRTQLGGLLMAGLGVGMIAVG